jgi:hypothetical protein
VAEDHSGTEVASIGPRIPPRSLVEAEYGAASRRRTARVVGLGVLMLAPAVVVVAMIGRDSIVAMWPSTAGIYQAFGLSESPGAGLKIAVTATRSAGGLVVGGDVVNGASEARQLPRLRVALRDGRGTELEFKIIDPPADRLAPGAAAHFETVFDHPNMAAIGAAATFAPGR